MLAEVFPDFTRHRLENIARTETTAALTQGRLAQFRENSRVAAVQFVAIMDVRTTAICRDRGGLIMMLDDPALAANTPPLHFQCRSTLVPVSYWDLEAGDPEALERFFGYLPEGAPKSLDEAMGGWKDAAEPLPGFGGAGAKPKAKPQKIVTAESSSPDLPGAKGYDRHPTKVELGTNIVGFGENRIEVVEHWKDTGELENVISTLFQIKPKWLTGITEVRFQNDPITRGKSGDARGLYTHPTGVITLSRAYNRDYRSSADRLNQRYASNVILHEFAHHPWFRDQAGNLRREWAKALVADNAIVPGHNREEVFAIRFVSWYNARVAFAAKYPNLAKFYEQFVR